MTRVSRPTLAALVCAVLVALLYVSPVLRDVLRTGLDWPIWLDHAEGVSLTTYGKWWVLAPHRYLSDGSSGEFPIYVYYVSDSLINLVAEAFGWPAMTVQAVLYGPALGFAFLVVNYLSIAAVVGDRRVALGASLLLSLGGNSSFVDRPDAASGLSLQSVLHVPFGVISLATAQSLGWVLLLPCMSLAYLARLRFTPLRAATAGALLALLFHTHTLTFVNVAAGQVAWLVLANLLERPRDRRFRAWLCALAVIAGAFLALAMRPAFPFAALLALGALAIAVTFLIDPNKRFYAWCYGVALVGALPYLVTIGPLARGLAQVQAAWDGVQLMTVGLSGFLLFFAAYIAGAALAAAFTRGPGVLAWLGGLLTATALLSVNHLWHWGNHPYRFAIHMLFPLVILAALGLRDAPRRLALPLAAWLAAVCAWDASAFLLGRTGAVRFRVADAERAGFLARVREATAPAERTGQRILAPAELSYPRGVFQAATLMNYSRIPAFVPDHRHVLWRERYDNRMGLFCFLFPGYPNLDYPFGRQACEEPLDPEPDVAGIRDQRLRTQILPLYRISFAGAPGKPFSGYLKAAVDGYGWPLVASNDSAALVRTEAARLPGLARLEPAESGDDTLVVRVLPAASGPHLVLLGGRMLLERAPRIVLDGRALEGGRRSVNWALLDAELGAGEHRLELPALSRGPTPRAEYLYFAAVVHANEAGRYLDLPAREDARTDAAERR